MGLIVTILLGALSGYLASLIVNRNENQGFVLNVVVGIVGSFLANLIYARILGVEARLDIVTVENFLVALLGAVTLLAIVNLFQRGRVR